MSLVERIVEWIQELISTDLTPIGKNEAVRRMLAKSQHPDGPSTQEVLRYGRTGNS